MTTKTWNGSTADWYFNSGADWTPTGDPGSGDAVVINSGEAELQSGDAAISVASISVAGGLLAIQDPTKTQSVSGNVSITGSGAIELDGPSIGGGGGSSLTIGGTLTNSSSSSFGVSVGNSGISSADTLTVNGTGGLSNGSTSEINIEGSATVQATLNVAGAAAGFGTAGVETGTVFLENDALLEFKSGQITTVNGTLWLNGANARVADAGALTTNSALTGLSSVAGNFYLENGATVAPTGNVSVTGSGAIELDGPTIGGGGGSSLTIGGTLTNSSSSSFGVSVGNSGISSADTLTVNGTGGLSNGSTSEINIEGSATVQATLNVAGAAAGFGTAGVETGTVFLENDALLEFKSGQITTVNGTLWLNGANARVARAAAPTTNSALTGLSSVAGNFYLENGATVAPTGNVSVTGSGAIELDGPTIGGGGGSSLTIGGTLTNSSSSSFGVSVGNTGISSADTLTVNGTGGLSNGSTSEINIEGSATVQATLNVAGAAAGFGTAGTETGTVFLENDALLEFKSGQITTVNGTLWLNGANARVARAAAPTTNSALTGLSSVAGNFYLENGATVAPTGNVSVTGSGAIELDGPTIGGGGGSSLTIGGTLTNSSSSSFGVSIGNSGISSADTLTVNGTGGLSNGSTSEINIEGSATVQATLNVAGAAAGFGTAGVETGTVFLENDALLEFKSGQITTVNGTLWLNGANARVARAAAPTTNSALTGLSSVAGNFYLENGATVAPTGNVSVTGSGAIELDGPTIGGGGGSSLTIGGTLTNSSSSSFGVSIGNSGISSADTLTVNGTGGLSNGSTSEINIEGSATVQATLNVAGAAAGFGTAGVETGTVFLENDALLEFKSGQITTVNGTLWLNGANARVADAGALTTNSALTGLSSVAGNFYLENGATVAPTGNVSVSGSGAIELDGPSIGGGGGSSLTIGGTLTNSSSSSFGVSIGNTGISSADTLTVNGTGGLSNTGDINIEGASASATANLVVTKAATSSAGTIFLNSFGDLKAAAVDITGGTLEGTGTVTGALNVTGGTVVGGTLNSTPGALNVSGAYSQSGSGVLQADINTSDTPQSSIVNVTGSPGTPSSPGSVNLSGGTLLIDAQSSLALNTPFTVMTFAANDLYGQFAQVKTEGILGSNTGNGDSVNLGNGDTLEVLYNEASGNVQVEVVTTPASTTYTWDVGSGTWNASSGADWNPPGNGKTPSSTSNVTIGTGGGGTVTLAQDQTIASLSITNGYTLSGSSNSITTTGNVSLASGATLSIDDMNVGGTFTDSGSATFAGVLTINGAGQFTMSNGSLAGGINGTGAFDSSAGTNTLGNVTIYGGTTFTTVSGAITDISSGAAIVNEGTFVIDATSSNAIVNLLGNATLSGGGAVLLKTKSGTAFLRGGGFTLTNTNDTIEGAGNIGDSGALTIVNKGTIDANATGQGLNVGQGGGGVTNTGTLEATGGGTLNLLSSVTNTGGAITASGTSSVVNVQSTTVSGGTLNTASGGLLQTAGTSTLNGATISSGSTYTTGASATTDLSTSLTNEGTFLIDGTSANAVVNLNNSVTLSGGGAVLLKTKSGTAFLRGGGFTLTNTNDTIEGAGTIGDNAALAIANQATIDANSSGQTLNLSQGGGVVTNTGTLEATNGGTLNVFSKVTNTGGAITANGGTVNIDSATITGGTLNATGANLMQTVGSSDLVGVTISTGSTYDTAASAVTQLDTSLTNDGTFVIDGSAANAIVNLGSNVTLSGGGVVTMKTGGGTAFLRGGGFTLTNTNDTIQGAGTIGDNGALAIVNQATIDANASGQNLNLNSGGGSVTNTGTLEATGGGVLNISGTVTNKTGGVVTANGGTVNVIGTISGGTLNTLNSGVIESSGTGTDLSGVTISSGSTYTAGPGSTTQVNGAIVNDGTFAINGATANAIVNLGSAVTLSGKGTVTLTSSAGSAYLRGSGFTLTNTNDTIQGAGNIGDSGALALVNKGTIDANSKGQDLNLNVGNGGVTNTKTLEATAGGVLQLFNKITNTGGTITASGKGSIVNVDNATIVGGTLTTKTGGVVQSVGTASDLNGVTISSGSTYTAASGTTTQLDGAIVNDGTFAINGATANAIVNLGSAVSLSGGGTVALTSSSGSAFLRGSGLTLTNTNDTIQGAGNIGDSGALTVANQATIDANVSTSGLSLNLNAGNGGVTNTGTLEATAGGTLNLFNTITNTGGAITASGINSTVNVNGTITGGTLNTASSGVMESSGTGTDLSGVTISSGSTYTAGSGSTTQLNGAIVNDGTFAINAATANAIVNLGSAVTLSGGGTVTLTTSSGAAFLRGSSVTLTNTNDTIQGAGNIGDSGALAIANAGTIDANSSGQNLNLGAGGGALTNTGVFEATNGGTLDVFGALAGAGQIEIGASSTVELGGATSENTTFLSATAATLLINNATTTSYAGVLNSFAKGDILELGNTHATSATPTLFNGTDTTLTVDLNSGGPLTYQLAGNLTGDTFSVNFSGSNSSIEIATPAAFAEAHALLSGPMASTDSSGVLDAANTLNAGQLNLAASLHAHS